MSGNNEYSLVIITGMMHHYVEERWVVMGPSRVGIYHDSNANSYRIVGRKIEDYEVVANCAINESFCYNKATPSFHQWRDTFDDSKVYGVKFSTSDDARLFGETLDDVVQSFENKTMNSKPQSNHIVYHHSPVTMMPVMMMTPTPTMTTTPMMNGLINGQSSMVNNNYLANNNNNNHQQKTMMVDLNANNIEQCFDSLKEAVIEMNSSNTKLINNDLPQYESIQNLNGQLECQSSTIVTNGNGGGVKLVPPPPPPPPPPPIDFKPPPPKPMISAKPDQLIRSNSTLTKTNSNGLSSNSTSAIQSKPTPAPSDNLFNEMESMLAKRRAKIEKSLETNDHESTEINGGQKALNGKSYHSTVQQSSSVPPVPPHTAPKTFTPIQYQKTGELFQSKKFNSLNNNNNTTMNGNINGFSSSSSANHSAKLNGFSMERKNSLTATAINNSNGYNNNNGSSIQSSSSSSLNNQQMDRLKEEILSELRQELKQFKQDLLNALRVELQPTIRR